MKAAIDTSVLVAAYLETHAHHQRASAWLEAVTSGRVRGVITVHALAEVWSVLTKLPFVPRIEPATARKIVAAILASIEVAPLSSALYVEALDRCVSRGLRSGAVFDALHLVAAEHAGADVVLTFNAERVEELGARLACPPAGPARGRGNSARTLG